VYDPGEWGVDELYLYIISDGSIAKAPRRKRAPLLSAPVPPPDGDACRSGRKASEPEVSAAHAELVVALQAEFIAVDLHPPPYAMDWSYEALRAYFESGGLDLPPDAP
jgi:hypothetical protein